MSRWAALGALVITIGVVGFAESEYNAMPVATEGRAPWMDKMSKRLVDESQKYLTNAWTCRQALGTSVYDEAQLDVIQTMVKLHTPLETALLFVESRDKLLRDLNLTPTESYDLCKKLVRSNTSRLQQIRLIVLEELRN